MAECRCRNCGQEIRKSRSYCLHLELFAAPEVEIFPDDMFCDHRRKMKEICEGLKDKDPKSLEEDVYICYDLRLCKKCRDLFVKRISTGEFI